MDAVRTDVTEGFACLARGDWAGAVRHLGGAVRRDPGRLPVVRGLATAFVCRGDLPAARRVLNDFTLAFPLEAEGWRLLGQLEWKAGRRQHAITALSDGLKRLPRSAVLRRQMDLFLGAAGELSKSARHATDVVAGGSLGTYVAAARGEPTADHELFRSTPARSGTDADWLDRVAQDPAVLEAVLQAEDARLGSSHLRELAERLQKSLQEQPAHADRQLALGRLQLKVGDVAAARLSTLRALALNPHYAAARELQARLDGHGLPIRRAA
jgi:tetratricopeptide (TPR) repeat protein